MAEQAHIHEREVVAVTERLYQSRVVTISGGIDQQLAARVVNHLLALAEESNDDIRLFINSQGGHVESGDTIHDVIRFIEPKVHIIGTGWVASAGALIYVAVPREQRYCLPNTRFLLHQPAGQTSGRASELEIETEEILKMRKRLNTIFAEQTGQSLETIERDTKNNFWLSAQEAVNYGIVGTIITNIRELRSSSTEMM